MKSFLILIVILTVSYILLMVFVPQSTSSLMVTYVIDGDTFVADGRTIRVWGIDAPEKDEPYYQTATLTLEGAIEGELLDCTFIALGKYRRDVMRCYKGDEDIAATMVKAGLAKDAKRFLGGYYEREEAQAQKQKLGIWKEAE